jgi:hypothetical protein
MAYCGLSYFFLFSLLETLNVDRIALPRPENGRLMRGCLEIGVECEWDYIGKYVAAICVCRMFAV